MFHYHDLLLSAWSDVAVVVLSRVLAPLLVPVLLVQLQTGLQLGLLLVHGEAVEAPLFTGAPVGQAVVVLARA